MCMMCCSWLKLIYTFNPPLPKPMSRKIIQTTSKKKKSVHYFQNNARIMYFQVEFNMNGWFFIHYLFIHNLKIKMFFCPYNWHTKPELHLKRSYTCIFYQYDEVLSYDKMIIYTTGFLFSSAICKWQRHIK